MVAFLLGVSFWDTNNNKNVGVDAARLLTIPKSTVHRPETTTSREFPDQVGGVGSGGSGKRPGPVDLP
ncbi:hypothetical protein FNV43_RR22169 [Rhamnella rubrinervis]|uniref:Uncharacterized protein n=1 Tax=Rhamnella rubrinervis TaxID=2594499 RepID=A0A8K0E1G9_9ROSA|nr:hypothetical protein FNV43_RR22169 [Rhamnella rubrinervis]